MAPHQWPIIGMVFESRSFTIYCMSNMMRSLMSSNELVGFLLALKAGKRFHCTNVNDSFIIELKSNFWPTCLNLSPTKKYLIIIVANYFPIEFEQSAETK